MAKFCNCLETGEFNFEANLKQIFIFGYFLLACWIFYLGRNDDIVQKPANSISKASKDF